MGRERRHERKSHKSHGNHNSRKSEKSCKSPMLPARKSGKANKSKHDSPAAPPTQSLTFDLGQFDALVSRVARELVLKDNQRPAGKPVSTDSTQLQITKQHSKQEKRQEKKVSIAGVFQKARQVSKRKKTKETLRDPELVTNFQEGLEVAHQAVDKNTKADFVEVYARFMQKLEEVQEKDATFLNMITEAIDKLQAPLVSEDIEIEMVRGGKRVKEIVTIRDRVSRFTSFIKGESVGLSELWHQWEEVQDEYARLGEEVVGYQNVGKNLHGPSRSSRYKKEMEELDVKHLESVARLTTESRNIHDTSVKKMKASERDLDLQARKDQEALLRSFLFV